MPNLLPCGAQKKTHKVHYDKRCFLFVFHIEDLDSEYMGS